MHNKLSGVVEAYDGTVRVLSRHGGGIASITLRLILGPVLIIGGGRYLSLDYYLGLLLRGRASSAPTAPL